ncbi:MAG: hypothetical protein IKR17_02885 [Bacteroidales bacterium]|nr:hypothetical protein [Bacteroidales bacterium]
MTDEEISEIADVLTEKPIAVRIGDREFVIEPLTLGKTLIVDRYKHLLDFNKQLVGISPQAAIMDVCKRNETEVCELIAILLTNKRTQIQNDLYITKLSTYVKEHTTMVERAMLIQLFIEAKPVTRYMKLLGISKEVTRWRIREKVSVDTLIVTKTDSVYVDRYVERVIEQKPTIWQRMKEGAFWGFILLVALGALYVVCKILRRK